MPPVSLFSVAGSRSKVSRQLAGSKLGNPIQGRRPSIQLQKESPFRTSHASSSSAGGRVGPQSYGKVSSCSHEGTCTRVPPVSLFSVDGSRSKVSRQLVGSKLGNPIPGLKTKHPASEGEPILGFSGELFHLSLRPQQICKALVLPSATLRDSAIGKERELKPPQSFDERQQSKKGECLGQQSPANSFPESTVA